MQALLEQDATLGMSLPDIHEPDSINLFELLRLLAAKRIWIAVATIAGAVVTAAIALVLPTMYSATAVIMPPQQQQSAAAALLGQLGPLASMAGRDLGVHNPGDLYVGILGDRTIADELVKRFDLVHVYQKKTGTDARTQLASHSRIASGKDSLIKISVDDRDPKRAAAIANAYVEELYQQTNRLALTESAQRRAFFERQLDTEKKALADAEVSLKATQEKTGVLQVNAQVDSMIRAAAQLRAEITAREVKLSALKYGATDQNPELIREQGELASLRTQLRELEASNSPQHSGDPFIPTSQVPGTALQYIRAARDLKYHETLFELLAKQYEAARIDEAKDAPLIQVVDSAVPAEKKSWPPRTLFTVAGAICSGFFACLWIVLLSRLQVQTLR